MAHDFLFRENEKWNKVYIMTNSDKYVHTMVQFHWVQELNILYGNRWRSPIVAVSCLNSFEFIHFSSWKANKRKKKSSTNIKKPLASIFEWIFRYLIQTNIFSLICKFNRHILRQLFTLLYLTKEIYRKNKWKWAF